MCYVYWTMRYLIIFALVASACCPIGSPCTQDDTSTCLNSNVRLGCGQDGRLEAVTCGSDAFGSGCWEWRTKAGIDGAECHTGDLPDGARCPWRPNHVGVNECSTDKRWEARCVDGIIHRVACESCPGSCGAF